MKASQEESHASATSVESGGTTTDSPSGTPATIRSTASNTAPPARGSPDDPRCCTTAHAPASGPPDLVDCIVALSIVYPGQSADAKNCGRRSSGVRCTSTDVPFGA